MAACTIQFSVIPGVVYMPVPSQIKHKASLMMHISLGDTPQAKGGSACITARQTENKKQNVVKQERHHIKHKGACSQLQTTVVGCGPKQAYRTQPTEGKATTAHVHSADGTQNLE